MSQKNKKRACLYPFHACKNILFTSSPYFKGTFPFISYPFPSKKDLINIIKSIRKRFKAEIIFTEK